MKNLTTTLKIMLLSVILLTNSVFGKNGKTDSQKDSLYCIEIDGKVLIPKGDESRFYKIELLCHNDVVDSGIVVDNESFLLKVKKNSWYTIRIIKEGYFPLVVSIDTRLPEYSTGQYKLNFDTELIVENYANISDDEAVDFPIAIISFNQKSGEFKPVAQYSKNIRGALFDPSVIRESIVKN